jgi:glycopeptide antibiotics resistance protein
MKLAIKLLILLPVLFLGMLYLRGQEHLYKHVSGKRQAFLALSIVLLYGWMIAEVCLRKQQSFFEVLVQSSFFVYFFFVLTLTGYFILFREVSAHHWWQNMIRRVDHNERVNLQLFKIFKIYKITDKQIIGNLVMLFPLGIYLPLLYKRTSGFFSVVFASFLFSLSIEVLQLVTSFRSADVDDVMLNTVGACFGFLTFLLFRDLMKPVLPVRASAIA